MQRRE
jgi:hypothetical protein